MHREASTGDDVWRFSEAVTLLVLLPAMWAHRAARLASPSVCADYLYWLVLQYRGGLLIGSRCSSCNR